MIQPRTDLGLIGLLIALAFYYACIAAKLPVGYFNDDARYINAATALSQGHYRDLELPGEPPNIDRLPGYPLLLAPLIPWVAPHWGWLQTLSILLMLGTCAGLYLLSDDLLPRPERLLLVGLWGMNPTAAKYACSVMSEPLFVFLIMTSFLFLRAWLRSRRPQAFWGLSGMTAWAVITRPEGLALAVTLPFIIGLRGRWRDAGHAFILPILALGWVLGRNVRVSSHWTGYAEQFRQLWETVQGQYAIFALNGAGVLKNFIVDTLWQADVGQPPVVSLFFVVGTAALMILGWRAAIRRSPEARDWGLAGMIFLGLYVAIHTLFLSLNSRYFYPLIPIVLPWLLLGVESLCRPLWRRATVWAGSTAILAFLYLNPWTSPTDKVLTGTHRYAVPGQTFSWMADKLPPDATVLAVKASTVYLFTNRHAVSQVPVPGWDGFLDQLARHRISHLLTAPSRLLVLPSREFLSMLSLWHTSSEWISENPGIFQLLYQNPTEGTALYRIQLGPDAREAKRRPPRRGW